MPTPRTQTKTPVRQPEEVGATGGAPTEGNLPTEIELVVVDRYGNKEVRSIREISYNAALKEAARMIYYDMAEEIVKEVLEDLPRPQFWAYIYNLSNERAYKVEMRRKHLTEVIVIPKHRAIYYFGGMEILGLDAYIPIEALYVKKQEITYYHVVRSTTAIDAIKQDLEKLLEGGK